MIGSIKKLILNLPFSGAVWAHVKFDPGRAPHPVKPVAIRELARQFGAKVFVETGTFRGDMVEAIKDRFEEIHSIELSEELHQPASARFADEEKIRILQGDSGEEIAEVIAGLKAQAVFWLDGHYSGGVTARGEIDTPGRAEREHILSSLDLGHVILIDDARLSGGDQDYPTLPAVSDFVKSRRPGVHIDVLNDSIRLLPRFPLPGTA